MTDTVDAELFNKLVGIQDIALGLGHLVVAEHEPRVCKDLLGQRFAECH